MLRPLFVKLFKDPWAKKSDLNCINAYRSHKDGPFGYKVLVRMGKRSSDHQNVCAYFEFLNCLAQKIPLIGQNVYIKFLAIDVVSM